MRFLTFILICGIWFLCSSAQAQTADNISDIGARVSDETRRREEADLSESVRDILSKIDESVVQEMERAWKVVGCGTGSEEAVLLLFRMANGSLKAIAEGTTNEHKAFNFKWDPSAIAIVHTHPNSVKPHPSHNDRNLANKLRVPIFTLTVRGMFIYDPRTKKVAQIQRGLEWVSFRKKESSK